MADRDPHRSVVLVLLSLAVAGALGAAASGFVLANAALLDAAVTLGLATGVLSGVALAQAARATASAGNEQVVIPAAAARAVEAPPPHTSPASLVSRIRARLRDMRVRSAEQLQRRKIRYARVATSAAGIVAIVFIQTANLAPSIETTPLIAAIAILACLGAAGAAALAARYLATLDAAHLPEAPGLCRAARVVAWILVLTALSIGLTWAKQTTVVWILDLVVVAVNAGICYGLLGPVAADEDPGHEMMSLDFGVLGLLGSRPNVFAGILDSAERQLGIDLRSTWALTVVRCSLEPLVIGLCLVGWMSTTLTVVALDEQGLVERLGVPAGGPPLDPGLHLHWPWPIDKVIRIPVQRVQVLTVGHEGQAESSGPDDVLWARQHAGNEYTLLLGNGRDLITVDAALQFRITDARAWRYQSQNPLDALQAIAYRAVMRNTVNRTLADALSENLVATTTRMRAMVQQDADTLGLGVDVLGFTVGGMHPPVAVAGDYQAVVSAELGKVTAVVNAQAFSNRTVPYAQTETFRRSNTARGQGAELLAKAAGEAWSFRTLQSQYNAAPGEYFFRRRLETLEKSLATRRYTVMDVRFQRDGGELWVIP